MKYLVSPLNWGLGHAVRCVPLIQKLLNEGNSVIIGSNGEAGRFLQQQFPSLEHVQLPNLKVSYSKSNTQIFSMLALIPKLILFSVRDFFALREIIATEKIDISISDNRFGLFSKKCKSVYITHQLTIAMPEALQFLEPIGRYLHGRIIRKYDELWVPDYEAKPNLAGRLSHPNSLPPNTKYIGPLCRFSSKDNNHRNFKYKFLFILSGAEPQRTILEKKIIEECDSFSQCAIVRGTDIPLPQETQIETFNILHTEELLSLIDNSEIVVCRSGYTSVMELYTLRKPSVLIPTPGQTEQEYLSEYLPSQFKFFKTIKQKNFSLHKLLEITT